MVQPSTVTVTAGRLALTGNLAIPPNARGIVVFAHGSGSSRLSPRNREVATALVSDGFATLLFDLLTPNEEVAERHTHHLRFDIALLSTRLVEAVGWVRRQERTASLPVALFGASTGAAAALIAATRTDVRAVVSRGGRPDLAGDALPRVTCPTLLIVGGADVEVLQLNRVAMRQMTAPASLYIVPGAGHLFEEAGALRTVIAVASVWLRRQLRPSPGVAFPVHRAD